MSGEQSIASCVNGYQPHLPVTAESTKAALSPQRARLVAAMQKINFGWIEHLLVRNGQPVSDSNTCAVRVIKLDGDNNPRPEISKGDFLLKLSVRRLFIYMAEKDHALIRRLDIKYGLPFIMTVEEEVII